MNPTTLKKITNSDLSGLHLPPKTSEPPDIFGRQV
jgi:hypothetical protein